LPVASDSGNVDRDRGGDDTTRGVAFDRGLATCERWYGDTVKPTTVKADPSLDRLATLGGLLGIKTSPLLARLTPLAGTWKGPLVATIPHTFNAMSITIDVARDTACTVCGTWLDTLPGDRIALELGATTTTAHSDEAALPSDAPELVRALGSGELVSIGTDGDSWSYVIAQPNPDDAAIDAARTRIDAVAEVLAVTGPQRRIAAGLLRSLARGMTSRTWLRARGGEPEPILGLVWDRVEWLPIQHMMSGFYPALDSETKIGRLSRNLDLDHATVELVLGPVDPPGMRLVVPIGVDQLSA